MTNPTYEQILNFLEILGNLRGDGSKKNTQSQKKRTMNSLTSPVTQAQGQVPPAGLYLIMRIGNRLQKTLFENVKPFPRYLEKFEGMSYFGIRKSVQIPLQSMKIRYSLQTMHFFCPRVRKCQTLPPIS